MKDHHKLIGLSEQRIGWISEHALVNLKGIRKDAKAADPAILKLLAEAEKSLQARTFTVMDKKVLPPSNSKHDYMSLSIYNWPNPDTADGLPYVTRDGHVNPEVEDYDRPSMAEMAYVVEVLLLSYAVMGELRYAHKAIKLLAAWFIDPSTRMNPNMLYAQYIPGNGGFDRPERYPAVYVPGVEGRGVYVAFGGVIEGVRLVPIVNLLPLLDDCPLWTDELALGIREWFRDFLYWLLEHQHGKDEASCLNNHGSWYCTQVVTYALFTGEREIALQYLQHQVPERMEMQIQADGSLPEELGRANSFHYVVYALTSFFNLALLGEQVGIKLWHHNGIRQSIDWLIPYLVNPSTWPYKLAETMEQQLIGAVPLLTMAYKAYEDPMYARVLKQLLPYPEDHRYRLLFTI